MRELSLHRPPNQKALDQRGAKILNELRRLDKKVRNTDLNTNANGTDVFLPREKSKDPQHPVETRLFSQSYASTVKTFYDRVCYGLEDKKGEAKKEFAEHYETTRGPWDNGTVLVESVDRDGDGKIDYQQTYFVADSALKDFSSETPSTKVKFPSFQKAPDPQAQEERGREILHAIKEVALSYDETHRDLAPKKGEVSVFDREPDTTEICVGYDVKEKSGNFSMDLLDLKPNESRYPSKVFSEGYSAETKDGITTVREYLDRDGDGTRDFLETYHIADFKFR